MGSYGRLGAVVASLGWLSAGCAGCGSGRGMLSTDCGRLGVREGGQGRHG